MLGGLVSAGASKRNLFGVVPICQSFGSFGWNVIESFLEDCRNEGEFIGIGYKVDGPTLEDRSLFFDRLIEASLSVQSEAMPKKSTTSASLAELPKALKMGSGPKTSELKAKVESEQHALRRSRMCLRDVCNRILYDKRFSVFHFPVTDEDAPNYRSIIQNPMDVATLLQRVDSGMYTTCSSFLQDVDLILHNAKAYNGDDYNGARIVSRAHELRDSVHGMLSQMDAALVAICDKITAQGGPTQMPDDGGGPGAPQTPVVQMAVTRASSRLRNVQPEVNLDQSYQVLKRLKKSADVATTAASAEEKSRLDETVPLEEPRANSTTEAGLKRSLANPDKHEPCAEAENQACPRGSEDNDVIMIDGNASRSQLEAIKQQLMQRTQGYGIPQLERLYTRIMKGLFESKNVGCLNKSRSFVIQFLFKFSQDESNF